MVNKTFNITQNNLPVSRIRCIASQCIATIAPAMLLIDIGMAITFVTIVLPTILYAPTGLSIDKHQASWFGSIPYLSQPLGALASGPIVDYFGRKKATFISNIPHTLGWILMYFTWNVPSLFAANFLFGFGAGVMEAPINSYVSEISEASIRGTLSSVTQFSCAIGISLMYLLGAYVEWRTVALICLSIPIVAMLLAIFVVPESPVWLIAKDKEKEALKSLCFLRGWTKPENVKEEFDELIKYSKKTACCAICYHEHKQNNEEISDSVDVECEHYKMNVFRRFFVKFNIIMLCKETLRPLVFCCMYFTFFVLSGFNPIKPNMINICKAMGMADDTKRITVLVGVLSFLKSLFLVATIKVLGKRKLGITGMLGSAICCTALSIYARQHLDKSVFSYDASTFPEEKSVVPLVFFYGLVVFSTINLCWNMLGEVFPFRSRGASQGIAAAWNYLVAFIGIKTFLNLETNYQLTGVFAIYAAIAYIGTIYLYLYMPETEGKSLQEIESFYQGKFRIFADDWFINMFKKIFFLFISLFY